MPEDFDDPDDRPRPRRRRDDDDVSDDRVRRREDDRPRARREDEESDDRPRRRRDEDYDDDYDDRPRRRRRPVPNPMDDPAMGLVLPVNTTPLAIAAGYMGLFSVLCFPAPVALILGILALRQLRRNPKKTGYGRAVFGIVMGALFTLVPVAFLAYAAIRDATK